MSYLTTGFAIAAATALALSLPSHNDKRLLKLIAANTDLIVGVEIVTNQRHRLQLRLMDENIRLRQDLEVQRRPLALPTCVLERGA